MKEASGGGPEGARMIGARKLRNGGVVYELSDPEAAKWLRWECVAFVVNFGGMSMLKERVVTIIVQFVHISYNPDVLAESQKVEHDSRLEAGAIVSMRWIKPVQRRADGQQTAHLIARLKTPEDANRAIRNGLIIAGKRVWARRMRRELRRCLKCQVIGANHFVAGCSSQNVCGMCGKEHRTAECMEGNHGSSYCTN